MALQNNNTCADTQLYYLLLLSLFPFHTFSLRLPTRPLLPRILSPPLLNLDASLPTYTEQKHNE